MKAASTNEPLLRPSEVAELFNITVATLESWRARNVPLPYVRLSGRAVRYRRSDVDAFVQRRSCSFSSQEP